MQGPDLRIEIDEADSGRRLDAVLAARGGLSRGRAADLVTSGAVTVDGRSQAKSYRLTAGEVVEADTAIPEAPDLPMPSFGIVFEDDDVIVVDKPSGVVVHPAGGVREPTLVDAIAASGRPLAARAGVDRPGVVHRLDRDVSGLLLVAKTDSAHERLVADLAARDVHRTYLALVAGVPQVDEGKIEAPVGRHPRHRTRMTVLADGKPSVTWFRVLETFGDVALLELRLETGRTHQIRTHLASIGHPILGDAAYGVDPRSAAALGAVRPLLHAVGLSLRHPISGAPLEFSSPLPEDLSACLDLLRSR